MKTEPKFEIGRFNERKFDGYKIRTIASKESDRSAKKRDDKIRSKNDVYVKPEYIHTSSFCGAPFKTSPPLAITRFAFTTPTDVLLVGHVSSPLAADTTAEFYLF